VLDEEVDQRGHHNYLMARKEYLMNGNIVENF